MIRPPGDGWAEQARPRSRAPAVVPTGSRRTGVGVPRTGRPGVRVWSIAHCAMKQPLALPFSPRWFLPSASLARRSVSVIGEAHRRFTLRINVREGWRGHLWQERFHSFLLDETHLLAAVRYVENNPVRAGLCAHAEDWPWSSARAHLRGEDDGLARVAPMLAVVANWPEYLSEAMDQSLAEKIHAHTRTGRPLGEEAFVSELEARLERRLRPQKRGPKPRSETGEWCVPFTSAPRVKLKPYCPELCCPRAARQEDIREFRLRDSAGQGTPRVHRRRFRSRCGVPSSGALAVRLPVTRCRQRPEPAIWSVPSAPAGRDPGVASLAVRQDCHDGPDTAHRSGRRDSS